MLDPIRQKLLETLMKMPFGQLVAMHSMAKADHEDEAIINCIKAAIKHRCYKTLMEVCGIPEPKSTQE